MGATPDKYNPVKWGDRAGLTENASKPRQTKGLNKNVVGFIIFRYYEISFICESIFSSGGFNFNYICEAIVLGLNIYIT